MACCVKYGLLRRFRRRARSVKFGQKVDRFLDEMGMNYSGKTKPSATSCGLIN